MTWIEIVWEVGRAVYSIGLLALGVVVIRGTPPTIRVLRDLTKALTATASGLSAVAADRESIDQLRASVARIEKASAADRKVLAEIKALLERLAKSSEDRSNSS